MADQIVVGMYDSRADAEAARARLIAEGVREDRIHVEVGAAPGEIPMPPQDRFAMREVDEPLPEDRGVSGFISRMFSGVLMDDANVEKYTQGLRNGRSIVAVRVESDDKRRVASTILERGGPRIYSLPNAPTAWNEASANDPASIGGVDDDPARPEGLLTDAEGLPVDADEARLGNASKTRNR
ncbi:MAG TPA: hypothetical protein VN858_03080 [Casimicrobiaceae bacterium]|nr:hypothetical protein [Casimicrobiaceae bacterium]